MKVLHIIDSLGLGGAQTVVKGIFEAQKDNKDIFLLALREREVTTEINHQNVSIFNSSGKYSLSPLFALKKLVQREEIDVLHCHLFRSNVFGWLLKKIWFPTVKFVVHEHGSVAIDGMFYRAFLKLSCKSVNLYIAVSQAMRRALVTVHIPSEKITVLHNFVDTKKFSRDQITWDVGGERKKMGIPREAFVVGFAGRLAELKGWREFLEAAQNIKKQIHDIKFVIAGEGADKKRMLRIISKFDIEDCVTYLGPVSNMVWFYSLLDSFVIPSHREGMPMVQLEAMAMVVPVVVTDVPALNEIVKDRENGLLFKKGDSAELARKIGEIRDNVDLCSSLIRSGRLTVEKFDSGSYIYKLNTLYVEL